MSVRQGEENVATLFGDVHYFYAAPEISKPLHHRFDKGSYVYLFENAGARRARVEIANHPGTDDQDAFEGFLDTTRLRYSHKQHCLVTLTAGGAVSGTDEWHLPTWDLRNENKYHYKLHSVDIYFWTRADALQFVNGIRRVLPPAQCEIPDEPAPPPPQGHPDNEMSAVVRKLESAAVSENAGGSPASRHQPRNVPSFAPPPASSGASADHDSANFAPMAYNPAAPAAPEAISHREKTPPPPEDGGATNPRLLAAAYDQQQPFSPAPYGGGFPGALASPGLTAQHHPPQGMFGHLQHPAVQRLGGGAAGVPPGSPGFAFAGSPGFAPQGMHGMHAGMTPPPPPPPPPPPSQPPAQAGSPAGGSEYAIHQQVYVPEGESGGVPAGKKTDGKGHRLEENTSRLERGMSGMLKKFEKKFG